MDRALHLVVAPSVPKSGRNGSFRGLFRASVHWCTRPRLEPRYEWFVADSCVRKRSRQPTFHMCAHPFRCPTTVSLRDKTGARSGPAAGCRLMPQQAGDLRSKYSRIWCNGTGVRDAHRRKSTALHVPSRLFKASARSTLSSEFAATAPLRGLRSMRNRGCATTSDSRRNLTFRDAKGRILRMESGG